MYDYYEAVKNDIKEYVDNELDAENLYSREKLKDKLDEELYDRVTGSADGSYFFNTYEAEETVCHNLDLFMEAVDELGLDAGEIVRQGAEAMDVTIRCYYFPKAVEEVLDDFEKEADEREMTM